jgi:hypothetical protein
MPEQAPGRIRERDSADPFRVPPPRSGDDPVGVPPPRWGDHLVGLHTAVMRIRQLARSGPVARSYVTARGAMVAMFGIFLFCSLVADWLGLGVLTGLGYVTCCVLAPFFVRREAQLHVVVAPPAIFMTVVIVTQILTAQGSSRHGRVLSVVEGTLLTLAAVAPWLFAGTALGAAASATRGLRECVRELSAELRGEAAGNTAARKA